MYLSWYYFLISVILISPFECYHHFRKKIHRRQSQYMLQTPQQMPQSYNSFQPPVLQLPIAHSMYPLSSTLNILPSGYLYKNHPIPLAVPSENINTPASNVAVPFNNMANLYNTAILPVNDAVLPENVDVPFYNMMFPDADAAPVSNAVSSAKEMGNEPSSLKNVAMKAKKDSFSPFSNFEEPQLYDSSVLDRTVPAISNLETYTASNPESVSLVHPYVKSDIINVGSRRKKKNIGEDSDALMNFFEKGKKLLKLSTVNDLFSGNGNINYDYHSVDDNVDNITVVPKPKGIQLKTVTKNDNSIIYGAVNIFSSTQKIISFDNNTELENVIEMQMEKKIEDEKGADKGFEEVRIVETERVKPMTKLNASNYKKRKAKNHKNRFNTHHRFRRNKRASEGVDKSKFLYNKIHHRFLSVIKRKERVDDGLSNLVNRHTIPYFLKINQKATTENTQQNLIHDREEMDDFIKFFLKEMKKFKKSRENKKNNYESFKRACYDCNSSKLFPPRARKLKKNLQYRELMNTMNLNMTWDPIVKGYIAKSVTILKAYQNSTEKLENTTSKYFNFSTSKELTSQLTIGPVHVNENQSARFLVVVLFFSATTFLLIVSTLVLPKLCTLIRINRVNSIRRTYKLYDEYLKNWDEDTENESLFGRDNEQLEWQSERGDWLSEKEYERK